MAGLGLALGGGAAAGAATLGDILKQKFLEQMQRQQLAEQARQADLRQTTAQRGLDIQQENLGEQRKFREMQQMDLQANRAQALADKDEDRKLRADTEFRSGIPLRLKGSYVSPVEKVRFNQLDQSGLTTPGGADEHSGDPHFHFTGTAAQATAEAKQATDEAERKERERHDRETERTALINANKQPAGATIKINTVDAEGNPVTRVMGSREARGQDFAAAPTTDTRNRQAATKRSAGVLQSINDLSEKINTGAGLLAKAQGVTEKAAAKLNYDDDVAEYQSIIEGFTPLVARAVGHTGVLTQQDVDSVKAMFPKPGDSKTLRDRKVAAVTKIMNAMHGTESGGGGAGAPPAQETPAERYARLQRIAQGGK